MSTIIQAIQFSSEKSHGNMKRRILMSMSGCIYMSLGKRGMLWSTSHTFMNGTCATQMVRRILQSYQPYECFCVVCNQPKNKPIPSHEGAQSLRRNVVATRNVHHWHINVDITHRCPYLRCLVSGNEQKAPPPTICASSSSYLWKKD